MTATIDRAKATLEGAGFVVLREKSYRQAQERQRVADALRAAAEDDAEHARAWARDCLTEERRLRERLTLVYGVARAYGAGIAELRGPDSPLTSSPTPGHLADDVWCRTCQHRHTPAIPAVTFMCAGGLGGCGFGCWDEVVAENHADVLPDHVVYACHHETVPLEQQP